MAETEIRMDAAPEESTDVTVNTDGGDATINAPADGDAKSESGDTTDDDNDGE